MKFSVTIPAYKPDFLDEAVSSVLAQSYGDWELIVVDDASPADLHSIMARYLTDPRVHYYRNERNYGAVNVVDNWNRCLEYCTGDYVICMGDDDKLLASCLENLCSLMAMYPGLGVYHSRTSIIDQNGQMLEELPTGPLFERSLAFLWGRWSGRRQFIGDFCFHTGLLRRNGGFFKLPLAWFSDELSAYIAARGDGAGIQDGLANTPESGFLYRINANSISSSHENYIEKMAAVIAAEDWYRSHFNSLGPSVSGQNRYLNLLYDTLDFRFRSYSRQYVREDVAADWSRLAYWIRHHADARLSVAVSLLQGIKGILR